MVSFRALLSKVNGSIEPVKSKICHKNPTKTTETLPGSPNCSGVPIIVQFTLKTSAFSIVAMVNLSKQLCTITVGPCLWPRLRQPRIEAKIKENPKSRFFKS